MYSFISQIISLFLSLLVCSITGILFYILGRIVLNCMTVSDENKLLNLLVSIAIGASTFLIVINLIGNFIRDFNIAFFISLAIILLICILQKAEFFKSCIKLKDFFFGQDPMNWIRTKTDRYFWLMVAVINFIYGAIAISTIKLDRFGLGNAHVFNINQLIAGNYPPKYSFLPNLTQKYHYGSDIFGAIVSKFSGLHPEITLDILTIVFLNLTILIFYALTVQYLNSRSINKYMVPFMALMAWGPITNLFTKSTGDALPQNILEKLSYLTQTRLIDSANVSGLVLHHFFSPPIGFSVFFLLVALYLLHKVFTEPQNIKFIIITGLYLSSFIILDFTKFIFIICGLVVLLFCYIPMPLFDDVKVDKPKISILKNLGIITFIAIVFAFVHGNWLIFNKSFIPLAEFYKVGATNLDLNLSPLKSNLLLLLIFAFGFYNAYKVKNSWVFFLLPFFLVGLILPYFLTIPDFGAGKIVMSSNLIGVFSIPFVIDFLEKKLESDTKKLSLVCYAILIATSFSTVMFWAFGDKEKPLFKIEKSNIKYSGLTLFPFSNLKKEEADLIKFLKSKRKKNQGIVCEGHFAEMFSINTGLFSLNTAPILENQSFIKKEFLDKREDRSRSSFSLVDAFWKEQKLHWLCLTPRLVKYILPPQARLSLLNSYLNNEIKSSFSNKKIEGLLDLVELYDIQKDKASSKKSKDPTKLLENLLKSNDLKNENLTFLKQIAICPYFGIYNAMSNDFDGDKIADIAFFDQENKKWYVVSGKDKKETEFDLNKFFFENYTGTDLFIPVPADYDGDSITDIALFNRTDALWNVQRSSDSKIESRNWGGLWSEIPLPGDVDGDSKVEFSSYSGDNTSKWGAITSAGNVYSESFNSTLLDIPTVADIDGDKKADLIVFRPQEQTFYIYLSTKTYNKQEPIRFNLGNITSRTVIEDYDGDGLTDIATWTPDKSLWEIIYAKDILSLPGSTTLGKTTVGFGNSGDIPMPADYNGDGKADIAVYHLWTGELEIYNNSGDSKKLDLSKYKNLIPANFIGV